MKTARALNYGSINEDRVYMVESIARPGETVSSTEFRIGPGGKGANQSVALAHAGVCVHHAGKVGRDASWLRGRLESEGVDVALVSIADAPTGHAVIQVDRAGENSIVIYGGTNQMLNPGEIRRDIGRFRAGDLLLIQNETNCTAELIAAGHSRGMRVCFNPAPMTAAVAACPIELVSILILNEHEATALTGQSEPAAILDGLAGRFPAVTAVLTWGSRGCYVRDNDAAVLIPACEVDCVDATAAGDTFVGYCLAGILQGAPLAEACRTANKAAALCVTKAGAMDAIPTREAVEKKRFSIKV